MGRYGRVGVLRQVVHPRIRGALDPSHEHKRYSKLARLEDCRTDEETYFVPSFSIRRHLHRSEEELWEMQQYLVKRRLGRGFEITPATDVSLKLVEQHRFIKAMRAAEIRPDPSEVRDLAYSVRDGLTNLLSNSYSPLELPLGDFERFGYKENAVAYEIEGWRGDRAHYGENDENGMMDPLAVLAAERQLAVGAIALAYGNADLSTSGIAPSPHATIARYKEAIAPWRMREIRGEIGDLAITMANFGDPVIDIKLYRDEPSETIYVKHAWDSLAMAS